MSGPIAYLISIVLLRESFRNQRNNYAEEYILLVFLKKKWLVVRIMYILTF